MLNPVTLGLIIEGIQAAIRFAPEAGQLLRQGKEFFTSLFNHGLISKETQDRVHAHLDAVALAARLGQTPVEFTVEPDQAAS